MKNPFQTLLDGQTLSVEGAHNLVTTLAQGDVSPALAGSALAILRHRGETTEEIQGAAEAMLDLSIPPHIVSEKGLLDTCGTGGDGSNSLNLSTGVSLLAAACGVPVVKHGNRSVSSQSGSADVLEALSLDLHRCPADSIAQTGYCFLFAIDYHPAMARIMPVRRALGVRTLFNILGPLSNPARPPFQVVGAYSLPVAEKMALALSQLYHTQRAYVVHSDNGWDEATPICPFTLFDVNEGQVQRRTVNPTTLGFPPCTEEDLRGGDARYNAMRLRRVLEGREFGPHRDALLLGAGLALQVTGVVEHISEGIERAAHALDTGDGADLLHRLARPPVLEAVNG